MAAPDNVQPPTYSLKINGTELINYADQTTWTISQNWSRQGDTATFYLVDEHADAPEALSYVITAMSTVVLKDLTLGLTLFSGVVTMPSMTYDGPNLARWQVQCSDWTYLADRAVVFGDFQTLSADQIIKSLTTQANCGITTNNVQPGPTIARLQINYLSLSAAWKKVCQYAGLISTYGWYVDENFDLHFYNENQAGTVQAYFTDNVTDLSTNYTTGFTGSYARDWQYLWDGTSIRNAITVRGANYSNVRNDLWVGDGSQASFPLTYTPDQNNLNPVLTVGGVAKTVSVQTGTSASTQYVVVQNANGQWFLSTNTDPAPASPNIVNFTYSFLTPVTSQVTDTASVAQYSSLPNHGIFGIYIADTSLQSIVAAQGRGKRELNSYSLPQERITFNTNETYLGHVRAGQLIKVRNSVVPDSLRSNAPGVTDTFLIVQNRISGRLVGFRSYQITAVRVSTGAAP